ncbi:sensor histidine kinase [Burkholderiaceae bacterium FT117]|uniref:sensor histidine kinase n=1 Tax=Zeimonas sediminis TaxID=2944268 RepID=UPI002342BFA3|nr:sensor histidine kinase [Zeimonas sediminis]MCM5571123.1 sensor histidine kinase [Zeimonas sediminis]
MIASLRQRILVWTALPAAVVLSAFSVYDYVTASRPATLAYDQALLSTALAIGPYAIGDAAGPRLNLPPALEDALRTDSFDRLWFAVRTLDGHHVAGDRSLPDVQPQGWIPVYLDAIYAGERVRVAGVRLPTAAGELLFVVGETRRKRDRMQRELVRSLVVTNLGLIAAVGLAVWFGVRLGLRPLAELRRELMARSHADLRPLAAKGAPSELEPIIREINSLLDRLGQAVATQNRFVANAAHQLRTPLAGLKTQLELVLEQPLPANTEGLVRRAREATDRIARMANQMLALARAEPGEAAAARMQVDLAGVIGELVDPYVHAALARDVDLGFELAPAPTLGDATLLRELAANLVDNAVRYCWHGCRVTVRTFVQGTEAVLEVEDEGPGIPPAERERVLERFYRIADTPGPGSGLGLAIVKEIAAAHHARLSLAPGAGGRGLRVTVAFPAPSAAQAPRSA